MRKEYKFKISVFGTTAQINTAIAALDTLALTGSESQDRLLIQQAIDEHDLRAGILYAGNFVWPFERSMKEFRKYNKSGSIEKLSNFFYDFLHLGCDDIAHYDKGGYIGYYDGDFARVKRDVIFASRVPGWHTDLQKILSAMQNEECGAKAPAVHVAARPAKRPVRQNSSTGYEQMNLFGRSA